MSSRSFETLIRQTANRFGIDIQRHRPEASDMGRLSLMLMYQKIDLVFDVGANTGQFAKSLRDAGYTRRLISFEPLSIAHAKLLQASRNDAQWEIAPRTAIGDHEGEIEMHIAGNSVSSSVLDMLDSHTSAAPGSAYVGTERAPLSRLDTIALDYIKPGAIPFIKIDTQGYEDRVLDGASELLIRTRGLQLELSFVPLYEGQKLFNELVERLRKLGFTIWAIRPGFCDPHSGRMLQADATFFRD
jgi:FkbM family methyltransferase